MKFILLTWGTFFLLLFCILRYGSRQPKPKTLPHYQYDTTYVDQYHVDSTGRYLLRWNGDTVFRETLP